MIPTAISDIGTVEFDSTEEVISSSLTFKLDFDKGTATGTVDGIEALKQAVFCRLMTEKNMYSIYEEYEYGLPMNSLLGQSTPLVYVSVANAITQTLLEDDRIISVSGFIFDTDCEGVSVTFDVESIFGTLNFEEVSL